VDALSRLNAKRFNGYLRIRLPHELDALVESAMTAHLDATAPARREMSEAVTPCAAGVLSAYGEPMAAIAVRTPLQQPLRRGLVAMGLAHGRLNDPRDNLYPRRPSTTARASRTPIYPSSSTQWPTTCPPPPSRPSGRSRTAPCRQVASQHGPWRRWLPH
jgi:hypothetical protein